MTVKKAFTGSDGIALAWQLGILARLMSTRGHVTLRYVIVNGIVSFLMEGGGKDSFFISIGAPVRQLILYSARHECFWDYWLVVLRRKEVDGKGSIHASMTYRWAIFGFFFFFFDFRTRNARTSDPAAFKKLAEAQVRSHVGVIHISFGKS